MSFNGLGMNLGNLSRLSTAQTRSISAENVYGDKGRGGMAEVVAQPQAEVARIGQTWDGPYPYAKELGQKWKVRPCITLAEKSTTTLMDVDGPGVIQHIWITLDEPWYRDIILRIYWDDEPTPSVEVPVGDFFCNGWKQRVNIAALPINVNPSGGFNCYFPMPFRRHAKITVENLTEGKLQGFFYTINYALTEINDDEAYFHAQFRRENPLQVKHDYVILDGVRGRGHYVGTYMAWEQHSPGWWGEGEFKAFIDGDGEFPTICGTGTEDYFGGAWCFHQNYSAPFLGYPLGTSGVGNRHGLYRFHVMDPIRFDKDLKVTMQALGWKPNGCYLPLEDDIASVAYWYQTEPHGPFPKFPNREQLDVSKRLLGQSEFIETWQISKLLPKKNDVSTARPASFNQSLGWSPITAVDGFVNVHQIHDTADGLIYLTTEVEVLQPESWTLALGHDGGVRVFIDTKSVLIEPKRVNPALPDRSKIDIELTKGRHQITIAFDTDRGYGWGIFARWEQAPKNRKFGSDPKFPKCVMNNKPGAQRKPTRQKK